MSDMKHRVEDPVAVYDVMREAATRLGAVYAQRVTVGGADDPAIIEIRNIDAEVNAIDPHDIEAQRDMTEVLYSRYVALVG